MLTRIPIYNKTITVHILTFESHACIIMNKYIDQSCQKERNIKSFICLMLTVSEGVETFNIVNNMFCKRLLCTVIRPVLFSGIFSDIYSTEHSRDFQYNNFNGTVIANLCTFENTSESLNKVCHYHTHDTLKNCLFFILHAYLFVSRLDF